MKKLITYLFVGIGCSFLLLGCSEITLPGEDGEETTIDFGNVKDGDLDISVEDSDGEESSISFNTDEDGKASFSQTDGENEFVSQSGENLTLPEDFPSTFPFPDGASYVSIQTMTEEEKKTHNVQFVFNKDLDLETVFNMYKEHAEDNGYQIAQELKMENSFTLHAGVEDEATGFNVILSQNDSENFGNVLVDIPQN